MKSKEIFSKINVLNKEYDQTQNPNLLNEVIDLCNEGLKDEFNEEFFFDRGIAYQTKGDINSALRDYNYVINLNPKTEDINFYMGLLYKQIGNEKEALKYFHKDLEIEPDSHITYYQIADIYFMMGKNEEAIAYSDISLLLNPEEVEAYVVRTTARYQLRDLQGSLEDVEKILEFEPDNMTYKISKSCLLLEMGKTKEGTVETFKTLVDHPDDIIDIIVNSDKKPN